MTEIWKPVPSVPLLEASSIGRVRSVPYEVLMPNGVSTRTRQMNPTYGYPGKATKNAKHVRLEVLFRRKRYKVHRLVCEAFHGPQPAGKPNVLHDDEDAKNNVPGNLKWGTQKENLNAPGFIAYCKSRTGENSPTVKGRSNGLQ